MSDLEWLKIIPADSFPRATKHIDEIIGLIQVLLEKNHAYVEEDGSVYFKISSFRDYGRLTGLNIKDQKDKNKISSDEYEKNLASDFALWKDGKRRTVILCGMPHGVKAGLVGILNAQQ